MTLKRAKIRATMQNVNWKRHGVEQHVSFNMHVGLHIFLKKNSDFHRFQLSIQHFCNGNDSKRDNRQDNQITNLGLTDR